MHDLQGGVGPARAVQKREAAERDLRLFAEHPHEQLATGERPSRNQRKRVEFGPRFDLDDLAFEVQFGAILDDDRVLQLRAFSERQRRHGVPLDGRAGAREGLDERRARAGADDDLHARINRKRALAAHDVENLDRLVDLGAVRHLDAATAEAHRLGERDHGIVHGERLAVSADDGRAERADCRSSSSMRRPLSRTSRAAPSLLRPLNARPAASIAVRSGADASGAASAIAARKSV